MDITQELVEYIDKTISSIVRGCNYEVALYKGHLYIFADGSILYNIDISSTTGLDILYGFRKFESEKLPLSIDQFNNVVSRYIEMSNMIIPQGLLYENINVREDQKFEELNNLKASEGCGFLKIPITSTYINKVICIPVFPGLPILSKADGAYLAIYSGNIPTEFIVHYKIAKKKLKTTYDIIFKIFDINYPLR